MPLLRKGVLLPVKGLDFSQPSTFIDDLSGFPVNMRFDRAELRKRSGKTQTGFQIGDASQIMGLGVLELSSGTKHLARASKQKLERYNTATGQWNSISGTNFTGDDGDFFSFATVTESGFLIITNGFDAIRKWIGSGNASALGGTPPKAKFCAYLSPYLLLAHTETAGTVNPWKVQWSDADAPEVWSGGNSGSVLLSSEPSPIQNIAKINNYVVGYKKDSIWLGRKVEFSDIFVFELVKTGIGLAAPRLWAEAEGQHYFMSLKDFHVFNGARIDSIGNNVRDEVFSRIDRNLIDRCFALHVQEQSEIWFFIVIAGYSWPTEIWKYHYRLGFWYKDTCDLLTAAIKYERVDTLAWDDALGTWDQQLTVWDASVNVAAWEEIVFGTSTGYTQKLDYTTADDNAVAVDAQFVTKDFMGEDVERGERWLQLDVWARGNGRLYVDYSTDYGSNWINVPYTSSQAWYDLTAVIAKVEWYFDIWAEQAIRFRCRNARSNEVFYVRSLMPYYVQREEVKAYRSN